MKNFSCPLFRVFAGYVVRRPLWHANGRKARTVFRPQGRSSPDFGVNTYENQKHPQTALFPGPLCTGFRCVRPGKGLVAFSDFENMDGRSAKALYNELETQLAEKYGKPGNYGTRENKGTIATGTLSREKNLAR